MAGGRRVFLWVVGLLLVWQAGVSAEPLPGLLDARVIKEGQAEAAQQKLDAQQAVRSSARKLGYDNKQIDRALEPTMIRKGVIRTKLKDGTVVEFPWFRTGFAENAIANTSKKIARDSSGRAIRSETNKGGVRLHHGVFADEVYALALKMDTKLGITGDAINGHSVRGAKGGIGAGRVVKVGSHYKAKVGDYVDPASPVFNRGRLMRSFARSYRKAGGRVGPGLDVQAGDVNTKAPEMKALAQAYGSRAIPSPGVSGKELVTKSDGSIDPKGGIAYRSVSTGEGVWMSARLAARRAGIKLRGSTVVAQGWGEVGRGFGMAAVKDGARVIAIQNLWLVNGKKVAGVLKHPLGSKAKPRQVKAWLSNVDSMIASGQDMASFRGGEMMKHFGAGADASQVKADIVGLNALGNVLTNKSVPQYVKSGTHQGKRKVLAEGANLAETAGGAKKIDANRAHLMVVTGDLANIGGVHVSNLEAVQNQYGEAVTDATARKSLQRTVLSGWRRAMRIADTQGVSERKAIELAAVDAMMQRSLQSDKAPRNSLEAGVISLAQRNRVRTKLAAKSRRSPAKTRATKTTAAKTKIAATKTKTTTAKSKTTATKPKTKSKARAKKNTQTSRAGMIRQLKSKSRQQAVARGKSSRGPGAKALPRSRSRSSTRRTTAKAKRAAKASRAVKVKVKR